LDIGAIALGALVGTIWWLLFITTLQPYIIRREIKALASGTSRYQEAIPLLTQQVFNSFVAHIKEDPENKKIVTGIIHGYGKSLADQAIMMLTSPENLKKMKKEGKNLVSGGTPDLMGLMYKVGEAWAESLID
jgi:hypothetical protein